MRISFSVLRDVLRPSWKHYFSLKASIKLPGRKSPLGRSVKCLSGPRDALVGENGAGKSTMMKVLTGIMLAMPARFYGWGKKRHLPGQIFPGSRDWDYPSGTEPDPALTIAENIFLGREFVNRFGKMTGKPCMPKRINCWLNLTCA